MSPADLPPFDDHGNLHPSFLAHIDQQRAKTREDVDKLVERFRKHADEVHGGDPVCAHAITACTLYVFRPKMNLADLAAGAIARLVEREAEIAELGRVIARYQTEAQDRIDTDA